MNRHEIASAIAERLSSQCSELREQFLVPGRIPSFILDDLLEQGACREIYDAFPPVERMVLKKSLREDKYVAAQMDRYDPVLEEIVFAFQDPRVISEISQITGLPNLLPDARLYAGGISAMTQGQFLNPHLDNSHDNDRKNYRVLNLLYYVTPDWKDEHGGNLELWDRGPGANRTPREICSKFNRLVVMATDRRSWHSVNPVRHIGRRCCVSNYYFSPTSLEGYDYFHVTSFRGRPEQRIRDFLLQGDILLRNGIRKIFKKGLVEATHIHKR